MTEYHTTVAVTAIAKSTPATVPGFMVLFADNAGAINEVLSTILMVLSMLFLLWRWRVAYKNEQRKKCRKDDG